MVDPSMQSCVVSAEYKDENEKIGEGLYEELPLFMLEKIYTSEEEKAFLKDVIVGRLGHSEH